MLQSALQALRTTPLRLMVLAQALAIAAQLSVLLTADRYQQLFSQEAAALLGGDMVVNADREPNAALAAAAKAAGMTLAKTTVFNSVVMPADKASDKQTLASVKAVDSNYPLRGKLTLSQRLDAVIPAIQISSSTTSSTGSSGNNSSSDALSTAPAQGTVWVDAPLLKTLGLKLGDALQLGESTFTIAAVIDVEPDRGVQFISFAPRVMLSQADLPATQLLGIGSRATYRWQMTGSDSAQAGFRQWLKTNPTGGQRLETLDEGRPEMRGTLDRASRFLGLIAILTTLIAACGLGLVAHIWAREQSQPVALMRTLGASSRQVGQRLLGQVAWTSALGLALGVAAGYALHRILAQWLVATEGVALPPAGFTPYLQAVLLLVVLLAACVAGPIQALIDTRPISILRGQVNEPSAHGVLANLMHYTQYTLAVFSLSALLVWVAGSAVQGLIVLAALVGVVLAVLALVYGLKRLALSLGRQHANWTVRTAARGLLRNPALTTVQAGTLTLALLGMLMLALLQRDVLGAWQAVLPKDAPNHFIFNIQPDQAAAVQAQLVALGVPKAALPNALQPMIRARLVQINATPVNLDNYPDERAKNLINREFNMSYTTQLPLGNELMGGVWHGDKAGEISMEAGILKTLNLKLGDTLVFDAAGQTIALRLSSVRKLRWESLNVNFFAIASPSSTNSANSANSANLMNDSNISNANNANNANNTDIVNPTTAQVLNAKDLPQTYIAAVYVPPSVDLNPLVRQFSNLTVLDVGVIAAQGRAVLDKVSRALTLLFGLGVVAGALVIAIIAYAGRLARLRETALLQVLGASGSQVRRAQLLEQASLGLLAGSLAGSASYLAVDSLTSSVLELPVIIGLWPIWFGALLGIVVNVVAYFALQWQWRPVPLGTQVRSLGL
jgi:putative ABC transport system permease protein